MSDVMPAPEAANAIRTIPSLPAAFRAGRVVQVRVFEPRFVESTMFGPTVDGAVREILRMLDLSPWQVTCKAAPDFNVEICRRGGTRPVAVIRQGLTRVDVAAALERAARS